MSAASAPKCKKYFLESTVKSQQIGIMLKLEFIDVSVRHLVLLGLQTCGMTDHSHLKVKKKTSSIKLCTFSFLIVANNFVCFRKKAVFFAFLGSQISNKKLRDNFSRCKFFLSNDFCNICMELKLFQFSLALAFSPFHFSLAFRFRKLSINKRKQICSRLTLVQYP